MTTSTRANRGALLLMAGGVAVVAGSYLPWARLLGWSVRGTSTTWGVATATAGAAAVVAGLRLARVRRLRRAPRLLALAASAIAVVIPAAGANQVERSLLEERLGTERFAPFLRGESAQIYAAVDRSTTVRPAFGLWVTLAGGAVMAGGAVLTARPQRHVSERPDAASMTTNATFTVTGMTCGGCVRRVRAAVSDLPGVTDVGVELASGSVTVTSATHLDPTAVRSAVETAGYEVAA